MIKYFLLFGVVWVAFMAPVTAQDEPSWDFEGYAALTTDQRDRGLKFSDSGTTLYGSLAAYHTSGFYGGLDASLIDNGFQDGERTEFFAGYGFESGAYIYDVSVELDGIHLDSSSYYPEFKASMARDFGLAYIRGGLSYAPEGRWNTPDVDSYYSYVDLEVPVPLISQLTVLTHIGYDARDGRSNLLDWSVGLSVFVFDNLEINFSYADSSLDQAIGRDGISFGARIFF